VPLRVLLKDGFNALEETQNAGTSKPVKNLESALIVFDDTGILQHRKMLRDCGNIRANLLAQLANASFAFGQFVYDKQPGGMRQGLHNLGPGIEKRLCLGVHGILLLVVYWVL